MRIVPAVLLAAAVSAGAQSSGHLTPSATIAIPALREGSGLVASRTYPDVFWAHNDSADAPRLFAFHRDGRPVLPSGVSDASRYRGITIPGARNVDWEDITIGGDGRLYIGDIGNNYSMRKELAIYAVAEPDPAAGTASRATRIPFAYAAQKQFPPPAGERLFDAEALFWADGKLHLITKRLSDLKAVLYQFDTLAPEGPNLLREIESFDARMLVTGAAATADGRKLAVLGYVPSLLGFTSTVGTVYVFERPTGKGPWFTGLVRQRRFTGGGFTEGICWAGDELIVTNEAGQMFELSLREFVAAGSSTSRAWP